LIARLTAAPSGVTLASMQAFELPLHARPRRMTRREYEELVAGGFLRDERVELIHGIIVEMAPIGPPHCDPIDVLVRHFVRGVGDRGVVRVQLPFAANDDSEPEPDLALVPPARYADRHPDHAYLLIEVAESSLDYDRETKAPLYAASSVEEYWIVDVNARRVEVYDSPASGRFTRVRSFEPGQRVAPSAFPDVVLEIAELFV
jgi:Uma2 family endonuclease